MDSKGIYSLAPTYLTLLLPLTCPVLAWVWAQISVTGPQGSGAPETRGQVYQQRHCLIFLALGFYSYLFWHFSAVEGKSMLLNHHEPLWIPARLEKLVCSRHSLNSKPYNGWSFVMWERPSMCWPIWSSHENPSIVKTSTSMSPACQSKHACSYCPSFDDTVLLPLSSSWHNVCLRWFFSPTPFVLFLSQAGLIQTEERNAKQFISESDRCRPAPYSRNLMWAINTMKAFLVSTKKVVTTWKQRIILFGGNVRTPSSGNSISGSPGRLLWEGGRQCQVIYRHATKEAGSLNIIDFCKENQTSS